jgi:hypothetical protein
MDNNNPAPLKVNNSSQNLTTAPLDKKSRIKKIIDVGSWFFLFAFLPVTVLIFLSQNTIPGDLFYPVKRGLEKVVLAGASLSPVTRAAFATSLTEERFKEAQSLVLEQSDTGGLNTFISDVSTVQIEVEGLKNSIERKKAEEKLIEKIEEYEKGLLTLQSKAEQKLFVSSANDTLSPSPSPTQETPTRVLQNETIVHAPPIYTPTPTFTPIPSPSPFPTAIIRTVTITPTNSVIEEKHAIVDRTEIVDKIEKTKEELKKIKDKLKKEDKQDKKERKANKKEDNHDKEYEDDRQKEARKKGKENGFELKNDD